MFDRNKPYNSLPMLPSGKGLNNDPVVLKKLVSASRALAAVNVSILRLPFPEMLINTIALHEAKTSTEIENIFTTEDKLYRAVSDKIKEETADPATKEVLRYREALWAGFRTISKQKIIGLELILTIFSQIKNTNAGIRPPQAQVVIRRGDSEFKAGEIIYTPPRGEGIVEKYLENLIHYYNNDPADPLIKMCVAHYQFEAIHPFQDGNGRTGRILNLLFLNHEGLISHPVLYLSKFIILNKEDYYHNLGSVSQRKAWKPWVLYMLDAVEKTSILTQTLINEIIDQMNATLDYGRSHLKWYNKDINELIFSQPYLKQKMLAEVLEKSSRTTLTKYLNELTNLKILRAQKDGKEVYYLNDDLIRILGG